MEQIYDLSRNSFVLVSFTLKKKKKKNQSEFHLLSPTTIKRHTTSIHTFLIEMSQLLRGARGERGRCPRAEPLQWQAVAVVGRGRG